MKNNLSVIFLAVSVLVLAALACSLPSGGALLEDDFEGGSTEWGVGTDADSSVEYNDGGLQMQIFTDNYIVWSTPNAEPYDQAIHIEVTVKNNGSDDTSAFGIICNKQEFTDTFYYFAISPNGDYVIADKSLVSDDIILTNDGDWVASDLIARNADSYRLGADCGNGTLTLYVDGQQIDSVIDSAYTSGAVGLFLWSADQIQTVDVTFDDFVVTKLK
jgi:hypothetical protein